MLKNLREIMKNSGIDLFIAGSTDEYLSEYAPLTDNTRYQITGFSGSTGDALVGMDRVYLFVDGRYHIQAEKETDPMTVNVVKLGLDSYPSKALYEKIAELSSDSTKIGLVSSKISYAAYKQILKVLENKQNVEIIEFEHDPITEPKNHAATQKLVYLPKIVSGQGKTEKLELINTYKKENGIDFLLITNLEEIAYLSNLRGNEIPYSACYKAKAAIYQDKLHLFRDEQKFNAFLKGISPENIYLNPATTTLATYRKLQRVTENIFEVKESYIASLKAVKNDSELEYIKTCYLRTDIVVNRAICWLNQAIEHGKRVSEKDFSDKVKEFFKEEGATGLSFEPITACSENSAIIHYTKPDPDKIIKKGDFMLLDCGGFFEYGYATDQTRTFLAGGRAATASPLQKQVYTTVLKGILSGLNITVDENTSGYDIDKQVRDVVNAVKPDEFSFSHATGHGVGIPVHEAPPRIGPSEASKAPLKNGMCFTIEPGIYCEGKGGVRLENTVAMIDNKITTLTRVPFDENLIDYAMLTEQEKHWLDEYNRNKIG